MKLTREEIGKSGGMTPLQLFSHGIRADATRRKYTATMRRILCDILEDIPCRVRGTSFYDVLARASGDG